MVEVVYIYIAQAIPYGACMVVNGDIYMQASHRKVNAELKRIRHYARLFGIVLNVEDERW